MTAREVSFVSVVNFLKCKLVEVFVKKGHEKENYLSMEITDDESVARIYFVGEIRKKCDSPEL